MPTETAVSLDSLVSRLRVSLADDYYCGDIKCAALVERLNLERQEAANLIERQATRIAELEAGPEESD